MQDWEITCYLKCRVIVKITFFFLVMMNCTAFGNANLRCERADVELESRDLRANRALNLMPNELLGSRARFLKSFATRKRNVCANVCKLVHFFT